MGFNYGTNRTSKDDYYFETKEYEFLTFPVEFVIIKDDDEWDRLTDKWFTDNRKKRKVQAWSELTRMLDDETGEVTEVTMCRIFIKDPKWVYQPELIGHEMAHCIWGEWHPYQNETNPAINSNSVLGRYP